MKSEQRTIATARAGVLLLAGCGKPQTETQPAPNALATASEAQPPAAPAGPCGAREASIPALHAARG